MNILDGDFVVYGDTLEAEGYPSETCMLTQFELNCHDISLRFFFHAWMSWRVPTRCWFMEKIVDEKYFGFPNSVRICSIWQSLSIFLNGAANIASTVSATVSLIRMLLRREL